MPVSGPARTGTSPAGLPASHESPPSREDRKRTDADARRQQRAEQARQKQIDDLEARIAEHEATLREIERAMAEPGFYDNRASAQPVIDRHQALMWELGDLMHQLGRDPVRDPAKSVS